MKKLLSLIFLVAPLVALSQIVYPETKKTEVVDDYNGTKVADPYRWLEDDNAADTKEWVKAQNKVTFDYLSKIPQRDKIRKRLEDLWNYPRYSTPYKIADHFYYFKNDGLQNQSVMY